MLRKKNLNQTQEVCSHNVPNKIQLVKTDYQFGAQDIYKVNLMDNFKAEELICHDT